MNAIPGSLATLPGDKQAQKWALRLAMCGLSLIGGMPLFAEDGAKLVITPTCDGELKDMGAPGSGTELKADVEAQVAHVGEDGSSIRVAVFEFALPTVDKLPSRKISAASLTVMSNAVGVPVNDDMRSSPMDIDVYSYDSKTADGAIDLLDWDAGKLVGRWLQKGETKIPWGTTWPKMDVTAVVQAAVDTGKKFIGFRLKAEGVDQTTAKFIPVRTSEFAQKFPGNAPTLTLEFE